MEEETIRIDGVVGILANPTTPQPRKRLVLIMHGLGGHKNYCYQRLLGQELPKQLGYSTFRFDFRNCGDSDEVPGGQREGRRVNKTDIADIDNVYNHFTTKLGYDIEVLVGHSRGTLAMFLWAKTYPEKSRNCINLINCSGRYVCHEYLTSTIIAHSPEYVVNGGYDLVAQRYGEYVPIWIPKSEVEEFAKFESSDWADIPAPIDVFTIFGTEDTIVPVRDSALWANLFAGRHELAYVTGADHNFYGRPSMPGMKKKSYAADVVELIVKYLQPSARLKRFAQRAQYSDHIERWPEVDGVANFRDAGGYGTVAAGKLYRSANLNSLTLKGARQLQDEIKVRHIVDFRAPEESASAPTPTEHIPKITVTLASVSQRSFSPQDLVERYADKAGMQGFVRAYLEILKSAGNAYRTAMLILRDHPGEPLLVHCTAGKDRTGVFCALVLLLNGLAPTIVAREYELTTFGLEPLRERLLSTGDSHGNVLSAKQVDHILSSKYESMYAAIKSLNEIYGGVEEYLKTMCGLSDSDLNTIKQNLRAESRSPAHPHL